MRNRLVVCSVLLGIVVLKFIFVSWAYSVFLLLGAAVAVATAILRYYCDKATYNINSVGKVGRSSQTAYYDIRVNHPVEIPTTNKQALVGFYEDEIVKKMRLLIATLKGSCIGIGVIAIILSITFQPTIIILSFMYIFTILCLLFAPNEFDYNDDSNYVNYNLHTAAVIHDPKDRIPITSNVI